MNFDLVASMIDLIRSEERKREEERSRMEPDAAYDQAIFYDLPFLNGLYLLVLVFTWHEVEKEVLCLAARADSDTRSAIERDDYENELKRLSEGLRKHKTRQEIERRLCLKQCQHYDTVCVVLRLLVNSYKHDPYGKPSKLLLKKLNVDTRIPIAPLPESDALQTALGTFLGVGRDAGYAEIAIAFVRSSEEFLREAESKALLRPFKREPVSLNPADFEQ